MKEKPSLKDTLIPKFELNESAGKALIREWKKNKKPGNQAIVRPGNIIFISNYEATTVKVWDKNPVLLILNTSKSYVLGYNINWLKKRDRERLLRVFEKNLKGRQQKPLTRLERLQLFKKVSKFKFPKAAIRVYKREQLKQSRIYQLNMGDFFEAVTKKLIEKIKI